jgi:hypothetical protein
MFNPRSGVEFWLEICAAASVYDSGNLSPRLARAGQSRQGESVDGSQLPALTCFPIMPVLERPFTARRLHSS